jgi:putrescine transport system ATP-binding protein
VVESTELNAVFQADRVAPVPVGGEILLMVRPEKMRIRKGAKPPEGAANTLAGVVRDIAYYGDYFVYLVALENGRTVRVSEPNLRRAPDMPITWHDAVVVDWPAHASVLLPA